MINNSCPSYPAPISPAPSLPASTPRRSHLLRDDDGLEEELEEEDGQSSYGPIEANPVECPQCRELLTHWNHCALCGEDVFCWPAPPAGQINVRYMIGCSTTLIDASGLGDNAAVAALILGGADVAGEGEGGSQALHVAAGFGRLAATRLLLGAGAAIDAPGFGGATPLAFACLEDRAACRAGARRARRRRERARWGRLDAAHRRGLLEQQAGDRARAAGCRRGRARARQPRRDGARGRNALPRGRCGRHHRAARRLARLAARARRRPRRDHRAASEACCGKPSAGGHEVGRGRACSRVQRGAPPTKWNGAGTLSAALALEAFAELPTRLGLVRLVQSHHDNASHRASSCTESNSCDALRRAPVPEACRGALRRTAVSRRATLRRTAMSRRATLRRTVSLRRAAPQ